MPVLADVVDGERDPLASPITIRISPERWHETACALKDQGASIFEWLSAVDRGDHIDVALHVRDGGEGLIVIAAVQDSIATVTDVWAGAAWHERETAEMFGITFLGHHTQRLLLAGLPDVHAPLKRSFALSARIEKNWPASDSLRRGQLPPGVNPEWRQS